MRKNVAGFLLCAMLPFSTSMAGGGKYSTNSCSGTNFDEVTLQPGCRTTCFEEPCEVYFRMPRGKGKYRVYGQAVVIGDYPAGRKVYFGRFWCGNHFFRIPDAGVPEALVYVGGRCR
jgi:hypothetical protein